MAYSNSHPGLSSSSRPLWHDPLFWGAVLSLGAHGVLWIVGPLLPGSDRRTESDVQRPVELVELSPIDQSRLPDAITQTPVLPELAEPDFSDSDFSSDDLTSDPPISFAPIFPSLPPPPPSSTYRVPRSGFSFPPRRDPVEETRRPQPTPTSTPNSTEPSRNTDGATGRGREALGEEPIDANPDATPGGTSETGESQPTVPQFPSDLVAQVEANPERFAFNEEGTDSDTANTNWGSWIDEEAFPWLREGGQSDEDLLEEKASRDIIQVENVPYPPIACVASAQLSDKAATELTAEDLLGGTATVGVLVVPSGLVAEEEDGEPFLIRSTGYGFLDEIALEIAREQEFDPTSYREIYQLQVNFVPSPETCQQLLQGEGAAPEEDA